MSTKEHTDVLKYTGPLSKVVAWIISYKDKQAIDIEDAIIFQALDKHEQFCHVQFESLETGEKLQHPYLWKIKEWKTCYHKHQLDKAASEKRRKEACLLSENTSLLMRSLSKQYGIDDPELLRGIAMKLARSKKQQNVEKLGIKSKLDMGD